MSVSFLGDCSFRPMSDPVFSEEQWALSLARVPYRGAATLRAAFERSLEKFSELPGYPGMFLSNFGADDHPVFPIVELSYIGIRKDIPPERAENSFAIQTVSVSLVPTAGPYQGKRVTGEFTFRAARTTWTWFELKAPPDLPRFRTVQRQIDPLTTIFRWRLQIEDSLPVSVDLATFIQVFNALVKVELVQDYQPNEIIPKKLWQCTAVVDYTLEPV